MPARRKRSTYESDPDPRIKIRSVRKDPADIDLLVEALLLIAQQQALQQEAEDFARSLAEPDEPAA